MRMGAVLIGRKHRSFVACAACLVWSLSHVQAAMLPHAMSAVAGPQFADLLLFPAAKRTMHQASQEVAAIRVAYGNPQESLCLAWDSAGILLDTTVTPRYPIMQGVSQTDSVHALSTHIVLHTPLHSLSCVVCRPDSGANGGWHPALDSGLGQSMAAESTLIYPKARPPGPPAPASLHQSSASLRPEGDRMARRQLYHLLSCFKLASAYYQIAFQACEDYLIIINSLQVFQPMLGTY